MIKISTLPHTWILDIDGTIVKHNGYKIDGFDTLLGGVHEFFETIPESDTIILLTARESIYIQDLKNFLKDNNIRYNHLITDIPIGERILINDSKPSGLNTAIAINKIRDKNFEVAYEISEDL